MIERRRGGYWASSAEHPRRSYRQPTANASRTAVNPAARQKTCKLDAARFFSGSADFAAWPARFVSEPIAPRRRRENEVPIGSFDSAPRALIARLVGDPSANPPRTPRARAGKTGYRIGELRHATRFQGTFRSPMGNFIAGDARTC
jgi:hypothetical protein